MTALSPLHYAYTHTVTEATTGYFSCEPEPPLSLEESLLRLEAAPMDEFLHRSALRQLSTLSEGEVRLLAATARPVLEALLMECALIHAPLADMYDATRAREGLEWTPLPHLGWSLREDREEHSAWSSAFAANILGHHTLPHPEEEELPRLYDTAPVLAATATPEGTPGIADIRARLLAEPAPTWRRPLAQETAARALEMLVNNGIIAGVEMRHEASLSPIALLRQWQIDITVRHGALDYSLRGEATTYGRGLSVADARASYAMEMVERASSYATVDKRGVVGCTRAMPIVRARYSELMAERRTALDPNTLPLEAVYTDAPLHWLEGKAAHTGQDMLVPAQCVYLFCNLDEPSLFMASGSTGLASGNTLAEAKVAALLEVLERDAEAVMPYDRSRCFTLRSQDARLQSLLDDYAARGIHVHGMDLTTEFGVPCYQCFVLGARGAVYRGTGAGLAGARAMLSALTEVPYPYPGGPASGPCIRGLPERVLEELPDYSLESPKRNLHLLEELLVGHGRRPLYVELTREDLEFPVVRAIVPGLELNPEPDVFTRISPRRYANYVRLFSLP